MAQMGKAAVVISAAHTDAIAIPVECHGRGDDQIKMSRVDKKATYRFPDAKLISFEFRFGSHFAKRHSGARAQNRDENALVCAPTFFNDFACIYFVMHRYEACHRVACVPGRSCANAIANSFGCADAFFCGHVSAGAQGALAKCADGFSHRWAIREGGASRLCRYRAVALEPEQQVGSAVAATGLPSKRPCSNAADRPRPRGNDLGSKGFQVGIEHRRKRQFGYGARFGYYKSSCWVPLRALSTRSEIDFRRALRSPSS